MTKTVLDLSNPREIRKKAGLTQSEFWEAVGCTQSGGSRYEAGRRLPKPVRELIRIVYIEKIPLEKVTRKNFKDIDNG